MPNFIVGRFPPGISLLQCSTMRPLSLLFIIIFSSKVECQNILWEHNLEFSNSTSVSTLNIDAGGNIIIYGKFISNATLYPQNHQPFLLKLNDTQLEAVLDSSTTKAGVGPIILDNHLYVCVTIDETDLEAKIAGTVYSTGTYLVKYKMTGEVVWVKRQDFEGIPLFMETDNIGNICIQYSVNYLRKTYKFNVDGEISSTTIPGTQRAFSFDRFGNCFTMGSSFIRKYSGSGDLKWERPAGGPLLQIETDEANNCYLYAAGNLHKFSATGELLWSTEVNLGNLNSPVIRLEQYNLYITGQTNFSIMSWPTVMKIDIITGKIIWRVDFDHPTLDYSGSFSGLTSYMGTVYFSGQLAPTKNSIVIAIEDQSYNPATTDLKKGQVKSASLKVVPNPSSGNVTVYLPEVVQGSRILAKVTNVAGKVVLQQQVENDLHQHEITIDTRDMSAGVYNVQLFSD